MAPGIELHVPADLRDLYEVHEYRHGAALLSSEFPILYQEICDALRAFRLTRTQLVTGGNQSEIPKTFSRLLRLNGWTAANKMAPEHQRLARYPTLDFDEIYQLPVGELAAEQSHLYLWVPNALLAEGLETMRRWGFTYKTNLVWYKIRKDGGPDGRGVGFYFRNVTELVLFGVRGSLRTLPPGRRQVNLLGTMKREHSRKPDELYGIIEACSPGPFLELFARHRRRGWRQWGEEVVEHEIGLDHPPPDKRTGALQVALFETHGEYDVSGKRKPRKSNGRR
jgi:N6-adenosine-specific RNA methylase IME4